MSLTITILHQKRLDVLKERQAREGISAAPEVITEIEDIEERIEVCEYELKQMTDQQAVYQQEFDSLQHQ